VSPDVEREVWQHTLRQLLRADPSRAHLCITEPVLNLPPCQAQMDALVFDHFGFSSYFAAPAPVFAVHAHKRDHPEVPANDALCALVVDAGFSFTHCVPVFNGRVVREGVKRINLGGRALTNYFKELVSFRSINLMEETFLVERIKDQVAFVSLEPDADLERSRGKASPFRLEYVLPDGVKEVWGHVRQPGEGAAGAAGGGGEAGTSGRQQQQQQQQQQQGGPPADNILQVNNERFMVPEALFSPGDLGLNQAGVPETVVQSILDCDPLLHPLLFSNILVVGGTAAMPHFADRLRRELAPLVPEGLEFQVFCPEDPLTYAWEGAALFAASPEFVKRALSREEYKRTGAANRRPFDN
jgi:actin-related protein 6